MRCLVSFSFTYLQSADNLCWCAFNMNSSRAIRIQAPNPYHNIIIAGWTSVKPMLLNASRPPHGGLRGIHRRSIQSIIPISRSHRNLKNRSDRSLLKLEKWYFSYLVAHTVVSKAPCIHYFAPPKIEINIRPNAIVTKWQMISTEVVIIGNWINCNSLKLHFSLSVNVLAMALYATLVST